MNYCFLSGGAFLVAVHLPNEIFNSFHKYDFITSDHGKYFEIIVNSITTDEDLRKFSPESRSCYFEGERSLKFYKSYTKANCDWECLTNFTLKSCGCVRFSMPRESSTNVCKLEEVKCYKKAMQTFPDEDEKDQMRIPCGCLPPCTDIKYSLNTLVDFTHRDKRMLAKHEGKPEE